METWSGFDEVWTQEALRPAAVRLLGPVLAGSRSGDVNLLHVIGMAGSGHVMLSVVAEWGLQLLVGQGR